MGRNVYGKDKSDPSWVHRGLAAFAGSERQPKRPKMSNYLHHVQCVFVVGFVIFTIIRLEKNHCYLVSHGMFWHMFFKSKKTFSTKFPITNSTVLMSNQSARTHLQFDRLSVLWPFLPFLARQNNVFCPQPTNKKRKAEQLPLHRRKTKEVRRI